MPDRPVPRKLVVLGDGACGKTSLLTVFAKMFENYVEMVEVDGTMVELSLWDTAGQEDFDRLRSLSYADTHVVMICFSVDSPESLENTKEKWIGEVNEYCAGVKVVLVALKCDLREEPSVKEKLYRRGLLPVSYEEGLAVARAIRATRYLECSAKHNRGVQEAIHEAARAGLGGRPKGGAGGEGLQERFRNRRCIIL